MAKINVTIPQPTTEYDTSNQQQQLQALDQIKNQIALSRVNQRANDGCVRKSCSS